MYDRHQTVEYQVGQRVISINILGKTTLRKSNQTVRQERRRPTRKVVEVLLHYFLNFGVRCGDGLVSVPPPICPGHSL